MVYYPHLKTCIWLKYYIIQLWSIIDHNFSNKFDFDVYYIIYSYIVFLNGSYFFIFNKNIR
jgi:hypothetical protein